MAKIIKHLFSRTNNMAVYSDLSCKNLVGYLNAGEWMGMVGEIGDVYHVITTKCSGFVRKPLCLPHENSVNGLCIEVNANELRYIYH